MFGLHVSKTDKMVPKAFKTYDLAIQSSIEQYGIEAAQIFTHGPQVPRKNKVNIATKIPLYAHSCYVAVGVWSNPGKWKHLIKSELEAAATIGALGLVVHLGPSSPTEVASVCRDMLTEFNIPIPIILETPSKKPGANHYAYPDLLNELNELIPKELNWGICIDTAHLWASGVDCSTANAMNKWLSDAPSNKVLLIHLNAGLADSFRTGKDLHIIPFSEEDGIWLDKCGPSLRKAFDGSSIKKSKVSEADKKLLNESGFAAIVQFAKKNNVPCIGEVNRGSVPDVLFYKSVFDYL